TTETGTDEPVENTEKTEPEEPAEVKKGITPLQPFDSPENLPDGFEEVKLETGEKVWHKGDFYIIYGMNEREITGWYVLDEKNSTYVAYDGLFDTASKKKDKDSGATIFGINLKVILIVLIIVIIILLAAVFFMALKLSRGVENDDDYDYDDYEDEEDEDEIPVSSIENSRGRSSREERASAKAEKEPKQSKAARAKDKFLNYFTTEVDDEAEDDEYYDDVDDDDDIDFIDI
ncbi:MAG: hypothetical protein II399_08525, partial [Lachnospiraceae bacterium]|nr:hypothetical protein [Lachnospiraceae bacterium]